MGSHVRLVCKWFIVTLWGGYCVIMVVRLKLDCVVFVF